MSLTDDLEAIFPAGSVIGGRWTEAEVKKTGLHQIPASSLVHYNALQHDRKFKQWLAEVDAKEASWHKVCRED